MVKMTGGAISWIARKREVVALSSTEAEYIDIRTSLKKDSYIYAAL